MTKQKMAKRMTRKRKSKKQVDPPAKKQAQAKKQVQAKKQASNEKKTLHIAAMPTAAEMNAVKKEIAANVNALNKVSKNAPPATANATAASPQVKAKAKAIEASAKKLAVQGRAAIAEARKTGDSRKLFAFLRGVGKLLRRITAAGIMYVTVISSSAVLYSSLSALGFVTAVAMSYAFTLVYKWLYRPLRPNNNMETVVYVLNSISFFVTTVPKIIAMPWKIVLNSGARLSRVLLSKNNSNRLGLNKLVKSTALF